MEHFGLELYKEKTKLISFGRFANTRNKERGYGKLPTFEFLGFTHYCGTKRKSGIFRVWRKTSKRRMNKRRKELRIELMKRRYRPIQETVEWLKSILQGHYNYFGVPGNISSMSLFAHEMKKA
ncbi:MAG: hypothetical protein SWO11_00805 [Thermodesulfobacteriota bacterium]|nr:hypothetical protein [Thermodesulfobacteriota bacterium]